MGEDILYALNDVDGKYILEADRYKKPEKKRQWLKWAVPAAAAVIILPLLIPFLFLMTMRAGSSAPVDDSIEASYEGYGDGSSADSIYFIVEYDGEIYEVYTPADTAFSDEDGNITYDDSLGLGYIESVTEEYAGDFVTYLYLADEPYYYAQTDTVTNIILYEYAPEERDDVYIVYIQEEDYGKYYIIVRQE